MKRWRGFLLSLLVAGLILGSAIPAFGEGVISFAITEMALAHGQNYDLRPAVMGPEGAADNAYWESDDPEVVRVAGGVVQAVKGGSANVSAKYAGGEASLTVHVNAVKPKKLTLSKKSVTISPNYSMQLKGKISPKKSTYKTITWVSSKPEVVSVTDDGTITGVSLGTALINATIEGTNVSATCVVKVSMIPVSRVSFVKRSLSMKVGDSKTLTVKITPATAADRTLTWRSSNPAVATVSTEGYVEALIPGKTTITATSNDSARKTASMKITVLAVRVQSVAPSFTYAAMEIGEEKALSCTVKPDNASFPNVTYTSSKPTVASVSEDGTIKAESSGTAIIKCSADGGRKSANVRILVRSSGEGKTPIVITAVGDITIGGDPRRGSYRLYEQLVEKHGGYGGVLGKFKTTFESDDFTIVNLESVLTNATAHAKKSYVLKAEPEYVKVLSSSSVEAANMANNHCNDFGARGINETKQTLAGKGIAYCYGGVTNITRVNGVRIGICGFHIGDTKQAVAAKVTRALRPRCDLLIASVHWGKEYAYAASAQQIQYGRALVDAGADLVLGHHSHVVSGIEIYKGKHIVYGLGTFSSCVATPKDMDTFAFRQKFYVSENGVEDGGIRIIPASMSSSTGSNNAQPIKLTGDAADRVKEKIRRYSARFSIRPIIE
ncbi:MAG: CapA family protein [Christensenellales bacterium]